YTAPAHDLLGTTRPWGASTDNPDIGAYENALAVSPYPDMVMDFTATAGNQSVVLNWTANLEIDLVARYAVYKSTTSGFTPASSDSVGQVTDTTYTVTGLTNGTPYYFKVRAINTSNQAGDYSNQKTATPEYMGPYWYVSSTIGDNINEGSEENPVADIWTALYKAFYNQPERDEQTIMIMSGTHTGNSNRGFELSAYSQSFTIEGATGNPDDVILDAENSDQHFILGGGYEKNITIKNITLKNGISAGWQNQPSGYATGGGSIYFANSQANLKVINCIFEYNSVEQAQYHEGGGAVHIAINTNGIDRPEFEDCIFRYNTSTNIEFDQSNAFGGAVCVAPGWYQPFGDAKDELPVIFRRCKFYGNEANYNGSQSNAAGSAIQAMQNIRIEGCLFYGNETNNGWSGDLELMPQYQTNDGTGERISGQTVLINNTFISGNNTSGNIQPILRIRDSDRYPGRAIFFNNIIANYHSSINPVEFSSSLTMNVYADYNLFSGSNDYNDEGSNYTMFGSDHDLHVDPGFAPDSANVDLSLSDYSRAIGAGIDSLEGFLAPSVDILGNPRPNPVLSRPDIGAYENARSEYRRLVYYVNDTDGNNDNDGLSAAAPLATISEALSKSYNRDTLELAAGTYSGSENRNLNMEGLTRIIRTSSGPASTIIDCENQGPAFVFEAGENDSVHISGLTIINGHNSNGGAVSIYGAEPVFENMVFRDNSADGNGGAVYANNSKSSFTNCVFINNDASQGGAIYLSGSLADVSLRHCTLLDNTGADDSGVKNSSSGDLTIVNSIYWGNDDISGDADVTYSNVMGGHDDSTNFNGRPGFTDAENGDFSLLNWSPMIGRGNTANIVSSDITGTARADSVAPDLGAYENTLNTPAAYSPVTWHMDTTGTDNVVYGSSATSPFHTLQWTLNHALEGDSVIVQPGDYPGSAGSWGKSVHVRGNTSSPNNVSILGEIKFTGGSNSVNMLRVSNSSGDGFNISAGAVTIADVLVDNSSGKAIVISDTADASLANMTLYYNEYGLYDNSSGSITMVNSIVWGSTNGSDTANVAGNPTVTYSDIGGGYTGTGNISSDPLFADAENGDFNLDLLSPCIDTGDPNVVYDGDDTVVDMGAFPRLRQFLSGPSSGDINVSADTTIIISSDFTVSEDDSMQLDAGAQLYFGSGATLTIEGILTADGTAESIISFLPVNPDSSYSGVVIVGGDGGDGGHRDGNIYSYIQISGVEADSVPLTIIGSATLDHVTIAGNGNAVSLSTTGTVDLNYSILEGQTDGTVNFLGSFTSSTDQFLDYPNDDFTLVATAAGIDTDTEKTDPDYTYGDAGAFYHDQSSYPVASITVFRPAIGDTILASPDTSTTVGLTSKIQLFNTYGRYKTKGSVSWTSVNNAGSFPIVSTDSTDLNGMVSNQYVTSTVSGSYNSFTVSADDASSTSGFYLVEPGAPDSVVVAVQSGTMTQLDSLTFTANIYDQFSNLVRSGEHVVWGITSVSGSGDGYSLSSDSATTDASGAVSVTLYTDPTDNTLSVGDQVTVTANSGSGSHVSSVVIIIPSDIYNLTLDEGLTTEELDVSADTAFIDFYTALVDTFDNPLENVEVIWEVVTGSGTGESLSAGTSNTNAQGVASTRLNTNTVSGTEYQVRCWVTESSLLNAFGSFESLANNVSSATTATNNSSSLSLVRSVSNSIKKGVSSKSSSFVRSKEIEVRSRPGQFVPAQIVSSSSVDRNINRVAAYDLDDTSAVVLVWPGVTASLSNVPQGAEDLELDEQFGFTLDANDQFGNLVRDNTSVTWEVRPSSANVSIVSMDDETIDGQAAIALQVASNATWDFSFKIFAMVEGISDSTGLYRIDDVTAPAAVSNLGIDPNVWTSNNDFNIAWNNPSEHSGVAGAHYEISGEPSVYVTGAGIQALNFSLPANDVRTVKLWLQDNAGNEDESNSMVVTAKWDDT
ncbi:MAG: choice-of-anchor Q domain-containing protein, partial [Candidatus Marinimicrobia bacterium]|nr:choice-of-anchor Q domain-containing protein [Candidatus Neomarinimicrobiota bacterium]